MHDMTGNDHQSLRNTGGCSSRIRKRLELDFNLALLGLFSLVAILALLPFFIYRASTGNMEAALGNGAVIVAVVISFAYAWFTGRTDGVRHVIVVCMAVICTYMVTYVGHIPFWVFPTVVVNFMLVHWRFALLVNLIMLLAVILNSPYFEETVDVASFVTAVAMVGFFSMVFASYTHFHRDRLGALVERDPLTGALNRRALVAHLDQSIASAIKFGHEHALVVLDLDDFKRVNDRYGHETGDRVLTDFARRVVCECRRGDLLYRLGGDEFVLLLSNTDWDGAQTAVNKLHRQIHEHPDPEVGEIRVSMGTAVSRPDESWQDWLARADRAMYLAKASGKDQVVFSD